MLSPDHRFWVAILVKKGVEILLTWLFEDMERLEPVQTIENKVIVGLEERQMKHDWIQNNEAKRADLDLFLKKLNVLHRLRQS